MRRRQKGDRRWQRQTMTRPGGNIQRTPHCPPPCGKAASPSKAAARDLYRSIAERLGGDEPVRYYQCNVTYGVWHWTRKGAR